MAKRKPATPVATAPSGSMEERIRERAYEIYVRNGYQDGRAVEDWIQAENEIRQEANAPAAETVSTATA